MPFIRVPPACVSQRDFCLDQLDALRRNETGFYAIIDLAASTDATCWHTRLASDGGACSLFQNQPESAAAEQAPWLLPIKSGDTRIGLRRTVDEAMVAQNVSWVVSAAPVDVLANRLSRRLTVRLPDGDALFRYYDPRLLCGWWDVLSDDERVRFGAFGTRWYTLNMDGMLKGIALSGEPEVDPLEPPWQVSSEQYRVLIDLSECHQLVELLRKRQPGAFLNDERGAQWRFVNTHNPQAKSRHVTRLADRLKYCEIALQHGDNFADEPRWQPVWEAMERGNLRLTDALERFQSSLQPT